MVRENVLRVKKRIERTCAKINTNPAELIVVAVSKNRTTSQIEEAIASGIADIGENRVQEAVLKYNQLFSSRFSVLGSRRTPNTEHRTPIKWHMIGHLQTNKVKDAVKIFDLIQSVDSIGLAKEIDKEAAKINKIQETLLEVKTSPEAAKFGLKPEEVIEVIKETVEFKNIKINGLMTIAPLADDPEKTRPYFRLLRELRDKINELRAMNYELITLSMGMTDDFQIAIEEGSTMVRIGRAIFEE